jgi:hypothetical protein
MYETILVECAQYKTIYKKHKKDFRTYAYFYKTLGCPQLYKA